MMGLTTQAAARPWRNWSGTVEARPRERHAPDSLPALQQLVARLSREGRQVRVVGSGHSFTPLVATDGALLSLERLSGVVRVDTAVREAEAWGGTRLAALGEALEAQGLAMENLGDINVQALAGAVSTGTHGTGAGFGCLSTQVVGLTLVTAAGEVVECDATREAELFRVARVSLGALGVLARLRLRLVPSFRLRIVRRTVPLEECLTQLDALWRAHRNFELYWFPYSDVALTKALDETEGPAQGRGVGAFLNEVVLENGVFWTACALARALPRLSSSICRLSARVASQGEKTDASARVFATPRLVRFVETEYGVPAERGADCLREVRAWVERARPAVSFPLEVRFVKGDDIPLSPAYGRDSVFIAAHMFRGMPHEAYFAALESIFRNHGGRPHWGKLHACTARELSSLYPEWEAFHRVRRQLDPRGTFLNPHLQRLFELG